MEDDNLFTAVHKIETSLGIPNNFYSSLLEEDDWSFVVKIHSLIEAAVTHILALSCGVKDLTNVFSLLDLSDSRKGKLAFLKNMNLLEDKYRRFIKTLSELRNNLVHSIQNVNFTFSTYLKDLDSNQRRNLFNSLSFGSDEKFELNSKEFTFRDYIEKKPKEAIWLATATLLAEIYLKKQYVDIKDLEIQFIMVPEF